MHLFFSTPIWTSKIEKYQMVNNEYAKLYFQSSKKRP